MPPDGAILSWPWFRPYAAPLVQQPGDVVIQSWDPASIPGLENDFTVGTTWLIRDRNFYLLEVVRCHVDYPGLKRAVHAGISRWKPFEVIIENMNTGTALIQELERGAMDGSGPLTLRQIRYLKPRDSKVARMAAESAVIEAGRVWIPDKAPWLEAFRQEVLLFPHGRYDDQIDSMSQFLYRMRRAAFFPPSSPAEVQATNQRPRREGWPRPGISF